MAEESTEAQAETEEARDARIDALFSEYEKGAKKLRKIRDEIQEAEVHDSSEWLLSAVRKFKCVDKEQLLPKLRVLQSISRSYVDDIWRIIEYHDTDEGVDRFKQAAYMAKWIVKFQPLFYKREFEKPLTELHLLVNERFAIQCMFQFIGLNSRIEPKLYRELLYTLRFRSFHEGSITMLLRAIADDSKYKIVEPEIV